MEKKNKKVSKKMVLNAPSDLPKNYNGELKFLAPGIMPVAEIRRDKRKVQLIKEIDDILTKSYYEDNVNVKENMVGKATDWVNLTILFEQDIRDVITTLQKKWSKSNRKLSPINRAVEEYKKRNYKNVISWEKSERKELSGSGNWEELEARTISVSYSNQLEEKENQKALEYIKNIEHVKEKREQHPLCPECGSHNVISKGASWLCKDCGRWFSKINRKPKKTSQARETYPKRNDPDSLPVGNHSGGK